MLAQLAHPIPSRPALSGSQRSLCLCTCTRKAPARSASKGSSFYKREERLSAPLLHAPNCHPLAPPTPSSTPRATASLEHHQEVSQPRDSFNALCSVCIYSGIKLHSGHPNHQH